MKPESSVNNELLAHAQNAMKHAYAPYSGFSVGAAILDNNNCIHAGCNVENSAYPEGVCAECSAISAMILNGGRTIKSILLVTSGESMATPCGGCRQKISEFSDHNTRILIHHKGNINTFDIEELLPYSFDKNHLPE